MFDNNVFIEDSCRNYIANGIVIGFELQTYITYYRAIPLSMVNDIRVKVDGIEIPRQSIRCTDGIDTFTLDEMTTAINNKWEYGEPLTIRCLGEGLSSGEHDVELTVIVRTAYIPVPIEGRKERKILIA